jgi:hypothetical protein
MRRKFKKFLESNENENKTYQNLWDTVKAPLRVPTLKNKNREISGK